MYSDGIPLTTLRHHDGSTTTTRTFAVNTATNRLSVAGYDADGNLLAWADETYAWDALGRMKHHNFPDEVYAYTADGERIFALEYRPGEPVRETWTLRDLDGKLLTTYTMEGTNEVGDWAWQKDHAYRGDTVVMAWTPEPHPEDRHYYSVDHLGTPRLVTDAAGNVESVHHYFGFGEELSTTSTTETKRFTGHERDFHTPGSRDDLDYMHARYYKAHMGRFLTVDPVNSAMASLPQSWNKYSYVLNNPTVLIDPNGATVESALEIIHRHASDIQKASDATNGRVSPILIARVLFQENRNDGNLIRGVDSSALGEIGGPELKNIGVTLGVLATGFHGSLGIGEMRTETAARLLGMDPAKLTGEQTLQLARLLHNPTAAIFLVARYLDQLQSGAPEGATPEMILTGYNTGVVSDSISSVASRSGPHLDLIERSLRNGLSGGPRVVRCGGGYTFEHLCR